MDSLLWMVFGIIGSATASSPTEPVLVRDFPLRSHGTLQIRNQRGSVHVSSWTLDKIRVEAVRREKAGMDPSAFSAGPPLLPEIRFKDLGNGEMELFADYGRGLGIYDKIKEVRRGDIWSGGVDLVVRAPARLALRLLVKEGMISVKNWTADIESRSEVGAQKFSNIRAGELRVFCSACALDAEDVKADAQIFCGEKPLNLRRFQSQKLYVETTSGAVNFQDIVALEQTFVSQDGTLRGQQLVGNIQFETQKGFVEFSGVKGHVQGRTRFGNIQLSVDQWKGEKGVIESEVGQIKIQIPASQWNQTLPKISAISAKGEVSITRQKTRK